MQRGAWTHAEIHTMETPTSVAEAMVWDEGRIVWVGSNEEVHQEAERRGIPVQRKEGLVVWPGFVDAHCHHLFESLREQRLDLEPCPSKQEVLDATAAWHEANPHGPLIAERWDEESWADPTWPSRADLDAISTTRPIVVRRMCGHIAVANTPALQACQAKWADERVDLETGVLLEEPSLYLNQVLPATVEQWVQAARNAPEVAHRQGVIAVGDYCQEAHDDAYERVRSEDLSLLVVRSCYAQDLQKRIAQGRRTGQHRGKWLRDGGVKIFLDGSLGARTAWLHAPYEDGEGTGRPIYTPTAIQALVAEASRAGIQPHVHAIGDAAVDAALDAFEEVQPPASLRPRIEHDELVSDAAIERHRRMDITMVPQPNFVGVWSQPGGMYYQRLGSRARMANRFRSFLDAGCKVAFGSDGMPFSPRVGLQAATGHVERDQRISLDEAVFAYTHAAARSLHIENEVGSLEPGRWAAFLATRAPWSQMEREPWELWVPNRAARTV